MAMIEKISITNFKSHAHTEIELGRVTALVGPNGCGKTSFLQAIRIFSHIIDEGWNHFSEFSDFVKRKCNKLSILTAGNSITTSISSIDTPIDMWVLSVSYQPNSPPIVEIQLANNRSAPDILSKGFPLSRILPDFVTQQLQKAVYFKPWWEALSSPSHSTEIKPGLAKDGSNLASVINYLKSEEDEVFALIEKDLREMVPGVQHTRTRRTKLKLKESRLITVDGKNIAYDEEREVLGDELIFDTTSGNKIPAKEMSEGTLLVLGLLTVLHSPTAPHITMLDDVERGLHPLAQCKLMTAIKILAEKYDKQIILTSHSPYIVDELEAKDVWVMATDKEGTSHCNRLSDHPDIKNALGVLTTGETWSAGGEDWVVDRPVQPEEVNA